ncbi:MAG: hypothetical protein LBS88_05025 [Tannerellaceae bacterium]|jgi:hypothetical protein|nr:hypothetical protein [Tannerellaceae bacterium]
MNRRQIAIVIISFLFSNIAFGQEKNPSDIISRYFREMSAATKKNRSVWDKELYGPVMLVNPETRQIYANMPDSVGELNDAYSVVIVDRNFKIKKD